VSLHVLIVGGGMITHDQILPAVLQMQRRGEVGEVSVVASKSRTIKALRDAPAIQRAFPDRTFRCFPDPDSDDTAPQPELYKKLIAAMPPRNIAIIALPDQLHYEAVMEALAHDQHVCCVKPLVLTGRQSLEIEQEAFRRGLVVGIEYHKRFDDRSLRARTAYGNGMFGEFRLGTARLMEKWNYRHSNFQNWCTTENSDAFTYIGCHYVDLVHYITGLLPVSVISYGIRDKYPNGNEGFLWCDTRVLWNNGAALNVQTSLSFPDEAPGPNTQGMTMHCAGEGKGGLIDHSDQYRGLSYCFIRKPEYPGGTVYSEPSPDYFQYNDLGETGLTPVGYGVRSVEFILRQCIQTTGSLQERQARLKELDARGILATPANSRYNELVMEAGRLSILNGSKEAIIEYGEQPTVRLKE
jgi:D-galacturonate reductase